MAGPVNDEVVTVVRLPIAQVAQAARDRHGIEFPLADVRIEADFIVLSFASAALPKPSDSASGDRPADSGSGGKDSIRRRRRKAKRNRMKTRGWDVVAKITNASGQTASIYKPFVDALAGPRLTRAQQRAAVSQILRSNGNKPTEASVEYYLDNTLEYLKKRGGDDSNGVPA